MAKKCCAHPYLDRLHARIVAIIQEQFTEFLEEQSDAQRGSPRHRRILHGHPILGRLLRVLLPVKGHVLGVLRGLVVDDVAIRYGFEILDVEGAAESRVSVSGEIEYTAIVRR